MNISEHFSADYEEARDKFREAATTAGARMSHFDNPTAGPGGGVLSTDIAHLGDAEAPAMLLTFSGTHGAEGFCGSGVQNAWLSEGFWRETPADVQQLHVHAINPFGFAALSRTTEDNVDLNRNFIDFAHPPENPGWPEVRAFMSPTEWDENGMTTLLLAMQSHASVHGEWAFREAATSGQHEDSCGVFFGGQAPTWSRQTVERIIGTHCGKLKRLAVIDYHTGLGPRGFGERIIDHLPDTPGYMRAMDWYGGDASSPYLGTSASARLTGQMLDWIAGSLTEVETTAIALEFGTLSSAEVLTALVADNWLRFHGDADSDRGRAIKAELRAAFYQDADDWKQMVWDRSLETQRLTLKGLTA